MHLKSSFKVISHAEVGDGSKRGTKILLWRGAIVGMFLNILLNNLSVIVKGAHFPSKELPI